MISVIIPVLNESATVESVVRFARNEPDVSEVIVVDDGSIDGTPDLARACGARVITSTLLGKGASMEDGMRAAQNETVVYLDGDLSGLPAGLVKRLTKPILSGTADFVKARFSRSAGRVTVLTARPLFDTFFPELSYIEQPLGGIISARRSLLRELNFEVDYGVDAGLLIDAFASGARLAQVDIGYIEHSSQSLEALGDMAKQVARVIMKRAAREHRLDLACIAEVEEVERHSRAELSILLRSVNRPERLALFDMDGTLLDGRFIAHLAERLGRTELLHGLLDNYQLTTEERTQRIGAVFRGVTKAAFEDAARSVPLMAGATEIVLALRKSGYRVGIVSDSFHAATETIRRRVFAEFSIAHLMHFHQGIATGNVVLSPAMRHAEGCGEHAICKKNALLHLCEHFDLLPDQVLAVGDSDADSCMLATSGVGIAVQPKGAAVRSAADYIVDHSLQEIRRWIDLEPGETS